MPDVQTPRMMLTGNNRKFQKNVFFVNSIILSLFLLLFVIGFGLRYLEKDHTDLFEFSARLLTVYTILFAIMQLYAFLEPFLLKHYDDPSSAGTLSLCLVGLVVIVSILLITKINWNPNFILNFLSGSLLTTNIISLTSKKYRENNLTFWINLGYVCIGVFFIPICMLMRWDTGISSLLIIFVYSIHCFFKSREISEEIANGECTPKQKSKYNDPFVTVALAGLTFVMFAVFLLWESTQTMALSA